MNYRQGEILILDKKTAKKIYNINLDQDIRKLPISPDNVIREGELSGHKNEVNGGQLHMFGPTKDDGMVLKSKPGGSTVSHPEHGTIKVKPEPDNHAVIVQKEYDEKKDKKVKD